ITQLALEGTNGAVVSTSGDLSFRFGDFLAGQDTERMRLTAEGKLGIGTDKPQAPLDVYGLIRTSKGIIFADGTVLTSAAGFGGGHLGTNGGSGPTSSNLPNTILQRDGSGSSAAGTITAALSGNATTATTSTNFTGGLAGEVTGGQSTTVVSNAVSANTSTAIVRRDTLGGFSAGTIALSGNLALPTTTTSAGAITLNGFLFAHAYGTQNTFIGSRAGNAALFGGLT